MNDASNPSFDAARAPLASLISKSEKAMQKLKPGSWQHTHLQNTVDALQAAQSLMDMPQADKPFSAADLQKHLHTVASLIRKTVAVEKTFTPSSAQHSLVRNRLAALRVAEQLLQRQMGVA